MEPLVAGDESLEAHEAHIWNHITAFINSMSLKCAIQLGIPDAIHRHGSNPMPLSLLASSLHLHPNKTQSIYRLMRLLTHSGYFVLRKEDEDEEGYMLTNSSRLLLEDNPCSLTPLLLLVLDPKLVEPWQFFSAWFQTDDRSPFKTAHGMPLWEFMENNLKDREIFNAGMASDSRLMMSLLLEKHKYVFEGIGSLVDVGGGTGTVAKAIAKVFPQIECTSFDLPQVVANLNHNQPNFKYVEKGDMFKHIPPADAILLKWILHYWNDKECMKILENCKEAITRNGNKGKVMVIDMVVDPKKEESIKNQLLFDILLMVLLGGKEREEKEWAQLIKQAGFGSYKIFPISGLRSLIEIYP